MSRRRAGQPATDRARCQHCQATVKAKFLEGHEAGCARNPKRDHSLPTRERKQ